MYKYAIDRFNKLIIEREERISRIRNNILSPSYFSSDALNNHINLDLIPEGFFDRKNEDMVESNLGELNKLKSIELNNQKILDIMNAFFQLFSIETPIYSVSTLFTVINIPDQAISILTHLKDIELKDCMLVVSEINKICEIYMLYELLISEICDSYLSNISLDLNLSNISLDLNLSTTVECVNMWTFKNYRSLRLSFLDIMKIDISQRKEIKILGTILTPYQYDYVEFKILMENLSQISDSLKCKILELLALFIERNRNELECNEGFEANVIVFILQMNDFLNESRDDKIITEKVNGIKSYIEQYNFVENDIFSITNYCKDTIASINRTCIIS